MYIMLYFNSTKYDRKVRNYSKIDGRLKYNPFVKFRKNLHLI